jgi:dTDP-4-dehydrorhamnose reductase
MINIFILGHKGMLGHMLYKVFKNNKDYRIDVSDLRYPNWDKKMFEGMDYVVNCIGAIPQKKTSFDINWKIPIWLNEKLNCRIIHPASDCEIDDSNYGISKRKATDYIKEKAERTKIIQTSIIGPELNSNKSLLEWFLSQHGLVHGYTKAIWNGITTLEWANQCSKIIENWDDYPTLNIFRSEKVSKYELLNIIKDCYKKDEIEVIERGLGKDKALTGGHKTKDIKKQLLELKLFEEL